jgi:arginase family enzyme
MEENIKIFGAALDALSSPERVNLKLAYIHHRSNKSLGEEEGKDPYDFIKKCITKSTIKDQRINWVGKISIPSWLTPKPKGSDSPKLSVDKFNQFLKNNGCWKHALLVVDYINKKIYPSLPVMIGVDHSLTGGSIMALAKRYPNLNVIILDAHFDVMKVDRIYSEGYLSGSGVLNAENGKKLGDIKTLDYYGCGNFLDFLLENKIISPKKLWILGVQDEISQELKQRNNSQHNLDLNALSIKKWVRNGVNIIFKNEVQSGRFKIDLNGPTYISVDIDVGSLASIYSARFMNSYGLNVNEFLQLLHRISEFIESSNEPLVGFDIMEFDIHFLEASKLKDIKDHTEQIVREIFEIFMINEGGIEIRYLS